MPAFVSAAGLAYAKFGEAPKETDAMTNHKRRELPAVAPRTVSKWAKLLLLLAFALLASSLGAVSGCRQATDAGPMLRIAAGSENKTLEPLLQEFARANGLTIKVDYRGSVDIMTELQNQATQYDAVWPANRIWISLGDKAGRVKRAQSIMTSPIVFAIKQSKARELGFVGREIEIKDILQAVRDKKLRFGMTSASQSNSGAMAYLGFLNALAGNPDVLTAQDLQNPTVREGIKALLAGVNRSAGSSEFLKELFLNDGEFSAMVNYEAMVIETNQALVAAGKEPLYVFYPRDSVAVADSPLAFVERGVPGAEENFTKLQNYLLSAEVQGKLIGLGRRTGVGGSVSNAPPAIFNPAWGVDANKVITTIPLPSAAVVLEALRLYQSEFRKPSYTVFCLDYSGSMQGAGSQALKQAMRTILDPALSGPQLLQPSGADVIVVIPFSNRIMATWTASGGDAASLRDLLNKIEQLVPDGGTDIYTSSLEALDHLNRQPKLDQYLPSVVLMTDGLSNEGKGYNDLAPVWQQYQVGWAQKQLAVPIYAITFGKADPAQLNAIAALTRARVFDGTADLVEAFKKVRGYN